MPPPPTKFTNGLVDSAIPLNDYIQIQTQK
jgi:hypothetical protein